MEDIADAGAAPAPAYAAPTDMPDADWLQLEKKAYLVAEKEALRYWTSDPTFRAKRFENRLDEALAVQDVLLASMHRQLLVMNPSESARRKRLKFNTLRMWGYRFGVTHDPHARVGEWSPRSYFVRAILDVFSCLFPSSRDLLHASAWSTNTGHEEQTEDEVRALLQHDLAIFDFYTLTALFSRRVALKDAVAVEDTGYGTNMASIRNAEIRKLAIQELRNVQDARSFNAADGSNHYTAALTDVPSALVRSFLNPDAHVRAKSQVAANRVIIALTNLLTELRPDVLNEVTDIADVASNEKQQAQKAYDCVLFSRNELAEYPKSSVCRDAVVMLNDLLTPNTVVSWQATYITIRAVVSFLRTA
jgi:hypothetical protein